MEEKVINFVTNAEGSRGSSKSVLIGLLRLTIESLKKPKGIPHESERIIDTRE